MVLNAVFVFVAYVFILIAMLALVYVGYGYVSEGFDRYRERVALDDVPVPALDAVAMGPVAVRGTAKPADRTAAVPFGNRPEALVYEVTVEDVNKFDEPLVEDRVSRAFDVESDDGSVRVEPDDLRFDLDEARTWSETVESHEPLPDDFERYADEAALPDQGFDRDREFAYTYLAPGDEVFVFGEAVPDDGRTGAGEKGVVVTSPPERDGFLSNKPLEELLAERRWAVLKHVTVGVALSMFGLAGFLWLSGIASVLLGA